MQIYRIYNMSYTYTQVTSETVNKTKLKKAIADSLDGLKESLSFSSSSDTDAKKKEAILKVCLKMANGYKIDPYNEFLLQATHPTSPTYYVGGRFEGYNADNLPENYEPGSTDFSGPSPYEKVIISFILYSRDADGSKAWLHGETGYTGDIRRGWRAWMRSQEIYDFDIIHTVSNTGMKSHIDTYTTGHDADLGQRDEYAHMDKTLRVTKNRISTDPADDIYT